MAIFGLSNEWFENLTLETRPKRHYLSASSGSKLETGVTGSVYVFAERSKFEKEAQPLKAFSDTGVDTFGDDSVEAFRTSMIATASLMDPVQIQQVTELTFRTEDVDATLSGGHGTANAFDYRDLLGHSSNKYIDKAFFDLTEAYGTVRRFYFYDSDWGNSKQKPDAPDNGSLHMVDLVYLKTIGDPSLSPDIYDVETALDMVASATCAAIDEVDGFDAVYESSPDNSVVTVTNVQYGNCEPPVSGVITNPFTGETILDLDLDADGIGDQDFPTFPYNIFEIDVATSGSATSINVMLDRYMGMVNDSEVSSRKQTAVSITRFEPSFKLTSDTLRKNAIKDVLFPHYRTKHPSLHWAFSNYNTINFFTSSLVPPDSALIYPSITDETVQPSIIPYSPSGSFTFEFYINPRYTIDEEDSYASGSFVVKDWEQLFIDFHQGGRGAHESPILDDYITDSLGNQYWYDSDGDPSDWKTAVDWGFVDDTAIEADGGYEKAENLVTDKGDEAPDYDFRSGDPIIKNCRIICNDGVSSGDQIFEFASPGNIHNATDWTIGKNEVGDFDNYATAVNIAKTIDGNEYFKSWTEKIEIIDEDGQQNVNEAGLLLWTDDNGLNEYTVFEAVTKDFPDWDEVIEGGPATINSYQATNASQLLWIASATPVEATPEDLLITDPADGSYIDKTTAAAVGYGEVIGWSIDGGAFDIAASHGYTGYYSKETGENLDGTLNVDGDQYWYDTAVDITDYRIAADWGYADDAAIETAVEVGASNLSIFPGHDDATEWSEQAWADYNGYEPGYLDVDGATTTLSLPDETEWMESDHTPTAGSPIDYAKILVKYSDNPVYPSTLEQVDWAAGQGYEAVMAYEPTLVYGKVWVQTLISGWDGNVGTIAIDTTQQNHFSWHAWEEVTEWDDGAGNLGSAASFGYTGFYKLADNSDVDPVDADPNSDGTVDDPLTYGSWDDTAWAVANGYTESLDTDGVTILTTWEWVKKYETASGVDEDARLAFADSDANEFSWDAAGLIPDVYSTIEDELDLGGGRDHVIVDREQSHAFNAGTILHMSSSYAISLVTGSHIDPGGHPDTFRIMLQLSSSADIPPSHIPYLENGEYGYSQYYDYSTETWVADLDSDGDVDEDDLLVALDPALTAGSNKIWLSSDNVLKRNHWHHVVIRYGTNLIDDGKAQIIIDGNVDTEFNVPEDPGGVLELSLPQEFGDATPRKWEGLTYFVDTDADDIEDTWASITDFSDTDIEADPAALFVGNFFEGKNGASYSQITSYLDADGNPTIEGQHVAEEHAWYVQEKDSDTGAGLWLNSSGIEILADDIPTTTEEPLQKTDNALRKIYFDALASYTLDEIEYTPILSSSLHANLSDAEAEHGAAYVYDQILTLDSDATQYVQGFFSYEAAERHGITWGRLDDVDSESGWTADDPDPLEPNQYQLRHPLNAEVHELKIWSEYRTLPQIWSTQKDGIEELEETLLFYLPPFFVKESREREVMLTPFQTMKSTTDDPFNVAMSFGVGGHLLNLENFCREFVQGEYPLLMNLTGSTIDTTTQEEKEANEFLNEDPCIRKRNLSILPCDNGLFVPDFTILASGSYVQKPTDEDETSKFVNDYGTIDYGLVTLRNMVPEEMMYPGLIAIDSSGDDDTSSDSIFASIAGSTPENPGVAPGSVLAILQRTRDTSSNEVVFFDVSNLFYGRKITPKTFELIDHDITGSGGKVKITLKDNGYGLLHRADAETTHPLWSSVGNIIYEEGIAVVHSPCIPYFGKEQFEVNLEGNHNIHIMEILIPCQQGQINSSSNPRYESLKASTFASEEDTGFVYVTGLNFHDENLNIVARTSLAQPIMKRDADNLTFRVKVDF